MQLLHTMRQYMACSMQQKPAASSEGALASVGRPVTSRRRPSAPSRDLPDCFCNPLLAASNSSSSREGLAGAYVPRAVVLAFAERGQLGLRRLHPRARRGLFPRPAVLSRSGLLRRDEGRRRTTDGRQTKATWPGGGGALQKGGVGWVDGWMDATDYCLPPYWAICPAGLAGRGISVCVEVWGPRTGQRRDREGENRQYEAQRPE